MESNCPHSPVKIIIGGFIALIALLSIYTWLSTPLIVTVVGTGEMTNNVLNSNLSFNVLGDGVDPTAAIGNLKAKSANIRKILVDSGTSQSDIFESQISVVPASTIVPGTQGFRSSLSMGAKNIPPTKIDSLIPTLYANGVALVSQPEISSENQSQLASTAFDAALKDADKQANDILRKNRKLFKKAVSITQSSQPSTTVSNKIDTTEAGKMGVGKIVSLVSVSYKMW